MKQFLALFILMSVGGCAYAQIKLGLSVSPSLSMNRVKGQTGTGAITSAGSAFRVKFGLEADMTLTETYVFSTGLFYASKRLGLSLTEQGRTTKEEYNIQYLQIPISVKLFTGEVVPDIKIFVQLGCLAEFKIFDEALSQGDPSIAAFRVFDVSFAPGLGVEYHSGIHTTFFGGIFYDRGLLNIVKASNKALVARMDMLSLKIGIKF